MREKREIPPGFADDARLSQTVLIKKYSASTQTIKKWRRQIGVSKPAIDKCDFRKGVVCSAREKSHCQKCGWNPKENEKILAILHGGGIKAVRKYIYAREKEKTAEREGIAKDDVKCRLDETRQTESV